MAIKVSYPNIEIRKGRCSMSEHRQDPQDKEFGAAAHRDAEVVDDLAEEGVNEEALPDERRGRPRAGGKAEPMGSQAPRERPSTSADARRGA